MIDVVDGDTIRVALVGRNQRLRYIGIDSPELGRAGLPAEWQADAATQANRSLVDGRSVVLERDVSETDRFGRLLRHVWLQGDEGWLLVNLEMVRLGFAQAVTFPPDVKYGELLREAERDARAAGRGLWADPQADVAP
ncbi:MAG TPA: thermonuclease family protein [Candidatus Limnocylindria bacterium]|nr:thermonuclease family protein [Candidatus Limnocylindria bacterium]